MSLPGAPHAARRKAKPPVVLQGHVPDSGVQPAFRQAGGEVHSLRKWAVDDERGRCVNPQTCRTSRRVFEEVPEAKVPQMVMLERALRSGGRGMADCCLSQVLDLAVDSLPALRRIWRPGLKVVDAYKEWAATVRKGGQ